MDVLEHAPPWLLRPLPVNAASDDKLHAVLDQLAADLPGSLRQITAALSRVRAYREYDAAANRAGAHVWRVLDRLLTAESPSVRADLLEFARQHLVEEAQARVCRRLVKDPDVAVRRAA